MPNGELAAALAVLENALTQFRIAYEAWLASGDGEDEKRLRAVLDEAEHRLDEARRALAHFREQR